ncbi:hypothetical protein [uncultured Flavobacterium sp.]|uniref:hypothetical protein n=1 Tax=uncultured Flavobacterium sp. TaxID=165435 RepID=UPI0030CA26E9
MEKAIELIWKEGFLKKDALIAPKINNLYTQKSIDIVEKFRKMYRINRIGIVLFAILIIPISYISKIPYMGISMAFLFLIISIIAHKFSKKLNTINNSASSYEYLTSFDKWTKEMRNTNTKLSRFLYPYIFIIMVLSFWFGEIGGDDPGTNFTKIFINKFPDTYLVFNFPLAFIVFFIGMIGVLTFFGERIGEFDLKLGYGRILKKLEILLADMEELRK